MKSARFENMITRIGQIARARDGRLTDELRRVPGGFGLGFLLHRLRADRPPA